MEIEIEILQIYADLQLELAELWKTSYVQVKIDRCLIGMVLFSAFDTGKSVETISGQKLSVYDQKIYR